MTQKPKSPVKQAQDTAEAPVSIVATPQTDVPSQSLAPEFGGRKGPEATRFGDWEMNGKCVDF